jgi:hypothetical protein
MKENEKCQVKWRRRRNDIDVCALRWSLAPFNVDILREEYEEESLYCWRRENIQYKKVDMIVASLCSGRRRIFICVCKLYTTRERERERDPNPGVLIQRAARRPQHPASGGSFLYYERNTHKNKKKERKNYIVVKRGKNGR